MMRKWEYAWLVVAGFFITVGVGIALEGHIFAERPSTSEPLWRYLV